MAAVTYAEQVDIDVFVAQTLLKWPGLNPECVRNLVRKMVVSFTGCVRSPNTVQCFLAQMPGPLIEFATCQWTQAQSTNIVTVAEFVTKCIVDAGFSYAKGNDPMRVLIEFLECVFSGMGLVSPTDPPAVIPPAPPAAPPPVIPPAPVPGTGPVTRNVARC